MNIVDANVLLYAINADAPDHEPANRWLVEALAGPEPVGFSWLALLAFLRLSTLPVLANPLSITEALVNVRGWLGARAAVVVHPTSRHVDVLSGLLLEVRRGGNLVNDAHLAALCIEYGAAMCTFDRDFQRFPGLRVVLPA